MSAPIAFGYEAVPHLNGAANTIPFPEDLSFEAWRDIGIRLAATSQRVQWWLGDWWAFGEHTYGQRAEIVAEGLFPHAQKTIRNYAVISRRYEPSRRRDDLPFTHHVEAANLPPEEADELLETAARSGWSTRQVRAAAIARTERPEDEVAALREVPFESPIGYALRCLSRIIGAAFDMEPSTFVGATKGSPAHVHARQILFYLLHTEGCFEQAEIADVLGRHRSTVSHAVQVVLALREEPEIDAALTCLGEVYRDFAAVKASVPALIEQIAA